MHLFFSIIRLPRRFTFFPYTTLFRSFGEEGEKCGLTFSPAGEWPPATYTIWVHPARRGEGFGGQLVRAVAAHYDLPLSKLRSEEHTSELQSHSDLVCRLLLEKKK